jgi:rod shape-determining protein MreB
MAVDLGTANTLVFVKGQGVVLNEPSVVAINTRDNRPLEVGMAAKRMIGRTPSYIQAIRPLRDGVIADFDVTEKMLRYFIDKVTIEEPMAAAIGVGLPVHEPTGSMVVDMGGGTTEVAVISLGGIVVSKSIRIGGDELDEAIIQWVKKEYSLMLGERTSEQIKMAIGSAWPYADEPAAEVRGRDLITGLPKTIVLSSAEVRESIEEPVQAVVDAVKYTLDKTPPELAADVMERGIVLTGGGAYLKGLDLRLAHETGMPIVTADRPLHSVVLGSGACLEEFDVLHAVLQSSGRA